MSQETPLQLHYILQKVQDGFEKQLRGRTFRSQAEVLQAKFHKEKVYLDLVEYDAQGTVVAKIKAIVREQELLLFYLKQTGLGSLDELIGQKILFHGRCHFHAQRGLSIWIDELSAQFTRGQLVDAQLQIKKHLQAEGIWAKNKDTVLGVPPITLAIISSPTSEGFRDFVTILEQSDLQVSRTLFAAAIHGQGAKKEVAEQLDHIAKKIDQFSAVVITRGGGGGEGLLRQNDLQIATQICLLPLPVILATGHTTDTSVLDEIVWHAAKTPSDAAHLILQGISSVQTHIHSLHTQIHVSIQDRIDGLYTHVSQLHTQIHQSIQSQFEYLSQRVRMYREQVNSITPEQILKKGYAILRDLENNLLGHDQISKLPVGTKLLVQTQTSTREVELKKKKKSK